MSAEKIVDSSVSLNDGKMSKSDNFDIDKIKDALNIIEERFCTGYPDPNPDESTMPQYKSNTPKDYKEIVEEAKEDLGQYEISNKQQIKNEFEEKFEQIDLKEEALNTEIKNEEADLVANNINDIEANRANMISRGLERSSISQNSENAIQTQFDKDLLRLIEEKQASLSELELKRSMVQNDMNAALEKFDIAYAAKLESKIEELTKKYDDEMIALEKYNVKIAELRNARNQEWANWVKDKTSQIDATAARKKVEYLVNIIKTLTREEALELMKDQEVIDSLGSYYQVVLDFANRRR